MYDRHSAPRTTRSSSPRPVPERQRSNSLPIVDALGCSTEEARLILAEGNAAVLRRRDPSQRRDHRDERSRSAHQHITTFRPEHHMQYLSPGVPAATAVPEEEAATMQTAGYSYHDHLQRKPSTRTCYSSDSASTITGPQYVPGPASPLTPHSAPASPLYDYSANLAKFIKSQLNSIPTYQSRQVPGNSRSCPNIPTKLHTPPQSPASPPKPARRPVDGPQIIEIPPVRPPLKSAFSAWSSTDDERDNEDETENDEDIPPVPVITPSRRDSMTGDYTPSILGYYGTSSWGSVSYTATPESQHLFAKDFQFPSVPQITTSGPQSNSSSSRKDLNIPPDVSYFHSGRPIKRHSKLAEQAMPSATPIEDFSPIEDETPEVHRAVAVSYTVPQRITVEGMSFDMIPNEYVARRVQAH